MSYRLHINGSRCPLNSGTLCRQKPRPEIVLQFTASVTTLFHNRHAKYKNYTESRLRSTTDQPSYVPSTSGQRQSMPLKLRHPMTPKNPTGNSIPLSRQASQHFSITATLNTAKYTESRLRSTTDQPPYVPSTSGQRQSMPPKLRHPMTPKNPTGNSIPRNHKRHNTFP
jgi:hypothetical protein